MWYLHTTATRYTELRTLAIGEPGNSGALTASNRRIPELLDRESQPAWSLKHFSLTATVSKFSGKAGLFAAHVGHVGSRTP